MIKDQDYLKKIADICLSKSKKLGSTDASILVQSSVSENINVRNKKLDGSERSENLGVVLTTYLGKKKSSIASSNLKESNLNELVDRCIETMKITPEDEYNSLPDKDLHFSGLKDLDLYDETHLSNEDKINYIKEAEDEAFSNNKIVNYINKIKPPYNINLLTEKRALKELKNIDTIKTNIKIILEERNKLIDSLNELSFIIKVYPSDSNFILIKVDDADLRYKQLIEKGIVLRNRSKVLLCDNCLRITVGTPSENKLIIKNFNEL